MQNGLGYRFRGRKAWGDERMWTGRQSSCSPTPVTAPSTRVQRAMALGTLCQVRTPPSCQHTAWPQHARHENTWPFFFHACFLARCVHYKHKGIWWVGCYVWRWWRGVRHTAIAPL